MSTAKNKQKEEPEKGMSTRRSAKSTERETTTLLTPTSDSKKSLPLLYLCSKCNAILSNSECIFRTIQLDEPAFLFPVQTETFVVKTDQVLLSPESEYDQFCAFYLVLCANAKCNSPLGKFYLSTTEKLNEAKSTLVVPENNLLIYDIKTSKVTTPAAKKLKETDVTTTAKKKVMSSTGRAEEKEKENREQQQQKSSSKEVRFSEQDRGIKYQSPVNTRIQEERKYDERSPNPLLESEEKDIHQIKQVDSSFSEMKAILTNFAQLLEQFDIRLCSTEKTILLINNTLNDIYKNLNVQEMIDLTES